jgi:hypothetical protein
MRIDEFKYSWTAEIENGVVQKGDWGGFSGSVFTDSGGAICFNPYTNPQEDVSIGVRHIPMMVPVIGTAGWYMKQLIKYPAAVQDRLPIQQSSCLRRPSESQGNDGEKCREGRREADTLTGAK